MYLNLRSASRYYIYWLYFFLHRQYIIVIHNSYLFSDNTVLLYNSSRIVVAMLVPSSFLDKYILLLVFIFEFWCIFVEVIFVYISWMVWRWIVLVLRRTIFAVLSIVGRKNLNILGTMNVWHCRFTQKFNKIKTSNHGKVYHRSLKGDCLVSYKYQNVSCLTINNILSLSLYFCFFSALSNFCDTLIFIKFKGRRT